MVVIGIPLRYNHLEDGRCILFLGEKVRRTFQKAGALIIPIVPLQDCDYMDTKYEDYPELTEDNKILIDKYLDMCDGIVFPGGNKISTFDEYLLERCVELNKKVLGICLGMQLISNYKRKFQTEEIPEGVHNQEDDNLLTHRIILNKNSKLYDILGEESILVNSFHKMHALDNEYLSVIARSSDGIIEGIEFKDKDFIVGIQWHPEISYDFDDNSRKLIDGFLEKCKKKVKND